jgi:hypothetical protein
LDLLSELFTIVAPRFIGWLGPWIDAITTSERDDACLDHVLSIIAGAARKSRELTAELRELGFDMGGPVATVTSETEDGETKHEMDVPELIELCETKRVYSGDGSDVRILAHFLSAAGRRDIRDALGQRGGTGQNIPTRPSRPAARRGSA